MEHQTSLTAQSIGKHAKEHLGVGSVKGRRPASDDFLETVRDQAHDALVAGELAVTLKDGISAQKALDARAKVEADRDWQLRLAMVLSGNGIPGRVRVIDPAAEALEAEFRPLLEAGSSG